MQQRDGAFKDPVVAAKSHEGEILFLLMSDLFYAKMLNEQNSKQDFILSLCQFAGDLDRLLILRE